VSRLSPLNPDDLDAEQRAVLDAIQRGPRGNRHGRIGLVGPFGVWVRAPKIGHAVQAFGGTVRFETALPERVKEVAICTVGAHHRAKFEFAAHRSLAIAAGVSEQTVEAIRCGATPSFDDDGERLAHAVTRALLETHHIDDSLYAHAMEVFGEVGLIELVTIVGYYCLVSFTLNVFEIPLDANITDPFPD